MRISNKRTRKQEACSLEIHLKTTTFREVCIFAKKYLKIFCLDEKRGILKGMSLKSRFETTNHLTNN